MNHADGPVVTCASGLHASLRAIDALQCAPDAILAWHFVGDTLLDGRPVPADGVELRHDGPVVMCESGLHASVRAIDALQYAPGTTACRVVMRDVVATDTEKLVARSRTILWRVDATDVLHEFARDCALDVLHMWATPETPGIDTVVEYLLTGDESLRVAAWAVARDAWCAWDVAGAAWDAAGYAWAAGVACDAAGDAWAAGGAWAAGDAWAVARDARAAARLTAWLAKRLATRDAWDAARAAARDARVDARNARDAVWDAQSTRLERMLEAAR